MIGLFHLSHMDSCETYGMGNLSGSSHSLHRSDTFETTEMLRIKCVLDRQETEAVLEVQQPNRSNRR